MCLTAGGRERGREGARVLENWMSGFRNLVSTKW